MKKKLKIDVSLLIILLVFFITVILLVKFGLPLKIFNEIFVEATNSGKNIVISIMYMTFSSIIFCGILLVLFFKNRFYEEDE